MSKDGGSLISPAVAEDLMAYLTTVSPYRPRYAAPLPPATPRQRLRAFVWDIRYRLAHALYPPAYYGDDD